MRLLECDGAGEIRLTKDYIDDNIPPYAILSHTWGAEGTELTFADLTHGTGKSKPGYDKIKFCRDQARRDKLAYFWVDTCCIDKSNSTELSEAINSMFRWYRNAAVCYVYLPDVSRSPANGRGADTQDSKDFRSSRWFTRGWTLQELLAPAWVEFFTTDGRKIGDKKSLERAISEATGIPIEALRGRSLSSFAITERRSWQSRRTITRSEDKAYSLLGIFGVHMPLIYGEGEGESFRRLQSAIDDASKGIKREDFLVTFSLADAPETQHFIAREGELDEMQRALSGNGSRRVVILQGLGGIGKTQLAVEYSKRHRDDYSAMFWLNIKTESTLKQSFARVAEQILRSHPSADRMGSVGAGESLDHTVDAVKAWLSLPDNFRWLMIYDNYDNPRVPGHQNPTAVDIGKFLPEAHQGSVIVTTRSSQVKIGRCLPVRKLQSMSQCLEILSAVSGRPMLIDDTDAVKLAERLDGFPLALATAGAYLDQSPVSIADYLRLYQTSWLRLQQTSPQLSSYEDRTLYTTWQISFERVREQNEASAELLRLWAYFDNQDLWYELLRCRGMHKPLWLRRFIRDELEFNQTMRVLCNYGLVESGASLQEDVESGGYSIHACVHLWTIHVLNEDWDYDLANFAVRATGWHIPTHEEARSWVTQRRLLKHATRCFDLVEEGSVTNSGLEIELHDLGMLFMDQGQLAKAEVMYQWALQGSEKALGPEHPSTLDTVNNLGILYESQGKLVEAEAMYQRALQGSEKALGPEHPSTLGTVNNLGILYRSQGKLVEAEAMYQRALQGKEKALGPEHPSTLDTVNNLGSLYRSQGKLVEAEAMYRRALQGSEKALGPEHPSTLATVRNLGLLFEEQDQADRSQLAKAEAMYQRVLQGYRKALGPEHPKTLEVIDDLRRLHAKQARAMEAQETPKTPGAGRGSLTTMVRRVFRKPSRNQHSR